MSWLEYATRIEEIRNVDIVLFEESVGSLVRR